MEICSVTLVLWSILSAAFAQDIPTGFKLDRYVRVWERNPFTLMKPTEPKRLHSAFDKLFLASWMKVDGKEVVMVQNSETNEVQRITASPNQNSLRLIQIHPNSNPKSVEVVISDGKEQETVKFRFDVPLPAAQTPIAAVGQPLNQIEMASESGKPSPAKLPRSQSPDSPQTLDPKLANMHPGLYKRSVKFTSEQ